MALSELVYTRAGSGEPVVLIHGIGHRRQAWEPIFDQLAEHYDVIAIDLAGFGESPGYADGVEYNMDNACADLAANFAAWGIEKPHVVGNSLGGAICLELGARGHASSVVVLSPAGFFGRLNRFQALLPLAFMRVASQLPDRVLRAVAHISVGPRLIGFLLYAKPHLMSSESTYHDALALKRASAFMKTIKAGVHYKFDSHVPVPTTVAWGTKDRLLPYKQSHRARKVLPNAHHVPLPDCGHVPMIDNPHLILGFIHDTIAKARHARAA